MGLGSEFGPDCSRFKIWGLAPLAVGPVGLGAYRPPKGDLPGLFLMFLRAGLGLCGRLLAQDFVLTVQAGGDF